MRIHRIIKSIVLTVILVTFLSSFLYLVDERDDDYYELTMDNNCLLYTSRCV